MLEEHPLPLLLSYALVLASYHLFYYSSLTEQLNPASLWHWACPVHPRGT